MTIKKSTHIKKQIFNLVKSIKTMASVLSKDTTHEGTITNLSLLEIEGKFKGTINGKSVFIRKTAEIEGIINAEFLTIEGRITGEIKSKNIEILKTAVVFDSNIEYNKLCVEDGASIEGNFKKINTKIIEEISKD